MSERSLPPQFIEGERAILGGLLLDNSQAPSVLEILQPGDFYREAHRLIFAALSRLFDREMPLDWVTLTSELQAASQLEGIGGPAYLGELVDAIPSASNLAHYVRIVKEKSLMRRFIASASEISALCSNGAKLDEILPQIEDIALQAASAQVSVSTKQVGLVSMKEVMGGCFEYLDRAYDKKVLPGISSGFKEIDQLSAGLQNGDLHIIAGRPSMGKTALMLGIITAAAQFEIPCHVFSLEMSKEQLGLRMISKMRALNLRTLRTGRFDADEWPRIIDAIGVLSELSIKIDDGTARNPAQIRYRCRERAIREKKPPGLIAIDYLQLMSSSKRAESREKELSSVSRELKLLAKEFKCPVIALSQLSRKVEDRPNKRPLLSDLRDSGAIEQDADMVIFLYREHLYTGRDEDKNKAEAIIAKQRNGPIGTVELEWVPETASYWSKR